MNYSAKFMWWGNNFVQAMCWHIDHFFKRHQETNQTRGMKNKKEL